MGFLRVRRFFAGDGARDLPGKTYPIRKKRYEIISSRSAHLPAPAKGRRFHSPSK
ncbi:MAG: hypothetical protein JMDDDDMK_02689 [Acidobacteria bacterium]|nr:hypothetical protein [Acidobacteriota bacterium]